MMSDETPRNRADAQYPFRHGRSWTDRFSVALRGIKIACRAELTFFVHLLVAAAVLLAGVVFSISDWEWCLVVLCIAVVLSAELINSSIERIACAITLEDDENIRDALDLASGAVLVSALGAVILGIIVFGSHLIERLTA